MLDVCDLPYWSSLGFGFNRMGRQHRAVLEAHKESPHAV